MTYRLRNILLAVVLAVLAAFLTALYVASYQNRVDRDQQRVKVFVAKADIAPGTPAADVLGKLERREVARKNLVPAWLSQPEQIDGQATSQWIYAGEQVTTRRFTLAGQGGIKAELKGNLRAIQLSGTQHQLLAGILKTGDRVDLVANIKLSPNTEVYASRVVLRDLRVLKAPSSTTVDSKLASAASNTNLSAVLEVTDAQVPKLLWTTQKHGWTLLLRPLTEPVDSPENLATLPTVLKDGLPRNQLDRLGGN
jgi:Flp pilus assembly protein CpaB